MSDDLHKKEASAVRALRKGVARYAEDIRGAVQHIRREVAAADQVFQQAVERRRAQLSRAEQELNQLQQAASRAGDADRAELEALASRARHEHGEAKRRLDEARQAASRVKAAQLDLLKVASKVEGKVTEHSSVASSALSDLDAKIGAYAGGASLFQTGAVTFAVAAGSAMNLTSDIQGLVQTGADALKGAGVDHSLVEAARHQTQADYAADQDQNVLGLYADQRLDGAKRRREGGDAK